MKIQDFSKRARFPGTTGNPFDVILHQLLLLEKIPTLLFTGLLFGIAAVIGFGRWEYALTLWGFFLVDWALLAGLPIAGKSYGPARPVVLMLAVPRALIGLLPIPVAVVLQALGTLLVIYGFWIEPHRLVLTHQKLESPRLPPGFRLRLLHLGDLHVERVTNREREVTRLADSLKPDLILFSGDFLNLSYLRDQDAWEAVRSVMSGWHAPLGVHAVTGSPAVDLEDVIPKLMEGLNIKLLDEDRQTIEHQGSYFDLYGLSCTHQPHIDAARLSSLMNGHPDRFSVLLYHSPDLAPNAAEMGIDLQLSGHTHGGQVRLPGFGALFTGSLYGKLFEAGRSQIGRLTLYITRGIGLEGASAPRVRFLCPPEVILWEITGADESHEGEDLHGTL